MQGKTTIIPAILQFICKYAGIISKKKIGFTPAFHVQFVILFPENYLIFLKKYPVHHFFTLVRFITLSTAFFGFFSTFGKLKINLPNV